MDGGTGALNNELKAGGRTRQYALACRSRDRTGRAASVRRCLAVPAHFRADPRRAARKRACAEAVVMAVIMAAVVLENMIAIMIVCGCYLCLLLWL